MRIYSLFSVLILAACSGNAQFNPDEYQKDLSFLENQLNKYHSGLTRYTSQDFIDHEFQKAYSSHYKSELDFYARITALISKIGCGHTRTAMSDEMRSDFIENQAFLPFTIKTLSDGVFVNRTLDDKLRSGDRILEIDGIPIEDVIKKISGHLPGDGFIQTGKDRLTELLFDVYYQLYMALDQDQYEVMVERNGKVVRELVDGVTANDVQTIRNRFPEEDFLYLDHREGYAYMRLRTFSYQALRDRGFDYEDFLEASFRDLKEKKVNNLILDLRGNGGGKDEYGALLVSYLSDKPFRYFDRIEVTKSYPGRSERKGDKHFITTHQGLSVWEPKSSAFKGNLYVLIDGFSFSTCADVATVLDHRGLAVFIGEETGGGYQGNTSGHTKTVRLPNTDIKIDIPMWCYTTAVPADKNVGRGVIPDHQIKQTWSDYLQEKDVVMDKAIELILK